MPIASLHGEILNACKIGTLGNWDSVLNCILELELALSRDCCGDRALVHLITKTTGKCQKENKRQLPTTFSFLPYDSPKVLHCQISTNFDLFPKNYVYLYLDSCLSRCHQKAPIFVCD